MFQAEKTLSWILKGGLLLTPFLVFIVTRSLYFPFITGKNFVFRILMEILAVIWVYAAFKFPNFRPRSSLLAWAVIAFIAVMGLATVFSLSSYRSFWSHFERMEGYIALLHLLLYFLLLGAVFRDKRDWKIFFHASLAASVIVSFYAILQMAGRLTIHQGGARVDATLGNATYLAAYLVFHLFFLVWFFLRTENRWLKGVYALAFLLEAFILYHTATRGAMLGALGGFIVLAALLALFHRGAIRKWALAGLGIVVLMPILFFAVKDTALVRKSDVLIRFALISPTEPTTQARFTIWNMALKGWKERPILGWGQESFVYIFSKYYEPSLWRQEPWFDRAHNIFLDWLVSGGALGLLSYLAIYVSAGWVLFRSLRRGVMGAVSFGVLAGLLTAHFFQNFFVFDNLTSWLLFFGVLAYVHFLSRQTSVAAEPAAPISPGRRVFPLPGNVSAILPVIGASAALALFLPVLYFANIKPIRSAKAILDALKNVQVHEAAGKVDSTMAIFQRGLDFRTFGTMETREQIGQAAAILGRDPGIALQDRAKYLDFAVAELEAQRAESPSDFRAKAFLATLYLQAGRPADAVAVANEALAVNDRRQQFYFIAAEAYLNANRPDDALAAVRRAYELAPDYNEAASNLGVVLILTGRLEEVEALFEKHYKTKTPAYENFAQAYINIGRFDKARELWAAIAAASPNDARAHAALGVSLARSGRPGEGIREIEKAIELEPRFKAEGEEIIKGIRSGQIR